VSLATLRALHFTNNVLNTSRFAQTVTIKTAAGVAYFIPAIVRRKEEMRQSEAGQTYLLETATVTVNQAALPSKPDLGWTFYAAGDPKAYMYALDGEIDDLTYTLIFERVAYKAS
jgi:hypothetical protein